MRFRNYAITWNLERNTIDDLYKAIDIVNLEVGEVKGFTIGHIEKGAENDYTHTHALICFKNPINITTIIAFFKGTHIESVNNFRKYREYMKKDGNFEFDNLGSYSDDDTILEDLLNCVKFVDFIKLHPNLISKIDKYEKAYNYLQLSMKIENEEE